MLRMSGRTPFALQYPENPVRQTELITMKPHS